MYSSLAGVPPMVGFFAKLSVIQALVSTNVQLYIVMAIVAVMFSLIGAFYYLRVVKVMYFDDPVDTAPLTAPIGMRVTLSLNGAAVVLLGVLPGPLMAACIYAIMQALAS